MGSPVRGNGSPLAGRGLPPANRRHHAPLFLVDPELPRPEMRPAVSLTVFVPTITDTARPAPASAVSAVPAVMAWKVSRQVSSVFRKAPFQTKRPTPMAYMRMKMPIPRAISPGVTLSWGFDRVQGAVAAGSSACCSPLRYCPARGGGADRGMYLIWDLCS